MQHPPILGLTGEAGAGKDTVGELLAVHRYAARLGFADALYAQVSRAYGVPVSVLTLRRTKETPLPALALAHCQDGGFVDALPATIRRDRHRPRSPRQILQLWGTEYRRTQNPLYWIEQLNAQIARLCSQSPMPRCIVVTDVRFADEAATVRSTWNGQIWRITRPGNTTRPTGHISETTAAQIHADLTLHNAHDIRHLQGLVLGQFDECFKAAASLSSSEAS